MTRGCVRTSRRVFSRRAYRLTSDRSRAHSEKREERVERVVRDVVDGDAGDLRDASRGMVRQIRDFRESIGSSIRIIAVRGVHASVDAVDERILRNVSGGGVRRRVRFVVHRTHARTDLGTEGVDAIRRRGERSDGDDVVVFHVSALRLQWWG